MLNHNKINGGYCNLSGRGVRIGPSRHLYTHTRAIKKKILSAGRFFGGKMMRLRFILYSFFLHDYLQATKK